MPPGGGLHRSEPPLDAAARELLEETGCRLTTPRLMQVVDENLHGGRNRVHVIAGLAEGEPRPSSGEIVEARFFPLDDLPLEAGGASVGKIGHWLRDYP